MIELADFLLFLHYLPHGIFIATFLTGLAVAVGWALRRRRVSANAESGPASEN